MLGYVRCATGDLLVKHHALYQAMYCGLCHSIDKNVGKSLLPFLSYDFVFLAILRSAATHERIEIEKQFCPLHPFKNRKKRVKDNVCLQYASQAALFLTYEKMQDDLADQDTSFGRKALISVWSPFLKRACRRVVKKSPELAELYASVQDAMRQGRNLEEKKASLDEMCTSFADCLALIFSFGTSGDVSKILSSLGGYLGRFLYTIDALDDVASDEKSGAFNPLLVQYGSSEKVQEHFEKLDLVLSYYVEQMKLAFDLLSGDRDLLAICENIICLGLSQASLNVMKRKTEKSE